MADEKLNTGQPDAPAPEPPAPEVKPPEQEAPAGAPGDVVVSADQIEKLMAERNAAAREAVDKAAPPEPEQPPEPKPEEKAATEPKAADKDKAAGRKRPPRRKSPRAGGAASPRRKKRGPALREGRGPARAARPGLIRRPPTRPRPNLETKCPKAKGQKGQRPPR